jgi:hypothetical protein
MNKILHKNKIMINAMHRTFLQAEQQWPRRRSYFMKEERQWDKTQTRLSNAHIHDIQVGDRLAHRLLLYQSRISRMEQQLALSHLDFLGGLAFCSRPTFTEEGPFHFGQTIAPPYWLISKKCMDHGCPWMPWRTKWREETC